MPPDPISEAVRLAEAAITDFEARMREVTPAYQRGDRVELHGEVFEVSSHQREGMPDYWLRGETEKLFWPMGLEGLLRPDAYGGKGGQELAGKVPEEFESEPPSNLLRKAGSLGSRSCTIHL